MSRVLRARRASPSQRVIIWLVVLNLMLVIAYATLNTILIAPAAYLVPLLLVIFNVLLSWLVIRRSRRRGDRYMVFTMMLSLLVLGVSLLTGMFF